MIDYNEDFQFPVQDEFDAMEVTELEFEISPDENRAYVNLDVIRGTAYREKLLKIFHIRNDQLAKPTRTYKKFLFSGHPGCGKTLELRRLHDYIDHEDRYTSILIELEQDLEIGTFKAEDFYILLISALAGRMADHQFVSEELNKIGRDWLKDEEIIKELKQNYKMEVGAETQAGAGFFGLLKLKSKLKTLFSYDSITSRKLREKVRDNPMDLIRRFNLVLSEARRVVGDELGRDLLFIMDGSEKIIYDVYQKLFVRDAHLLRALEANAIFSIPIHAYFDITNTPHTHFFDYDTLPMIAINDRSRGKLGEIITKRIDGETFFTDGVLDYCVNMSGGCPRQLLRIVNRCLVAKTSEQITMNQAELACRDLGQQMRDLLRSEHLDILRNGRFDTADPMVLDMLYQLVILKYNGKRKINPLIDRPEFL
ncbi:MAG: hypothetical protein QNK37_08115 [Acidobacteriota bacterium]|nr:hypothetical protein [Acidobacteriota bacterium]